MTTTYACLKEQVFTSGQYQLVPIRHEDLLDIKRWRNDQMTILRQNEVLTNEIQQKYYEKVLKPSFSEKQPKQILFSYLQDGTCIGYGGIVHIDWPSHRGELSFLLDTQKAEDPSAYSHDFGIYLELIKKAAFNDLKFHRLFTETFDIRPLHISILEKHGFIYEGRMKDHTFIENHYVDSLIHGCLA